MDSPLLEFLRTGKEFGKGPSTVDVWVQISEVKEALHVMITQGISAFTANNCRS